MSLLDLVRGAGEVGEAYPATDMLEDLSAAEERSELLAESLVDAQLALDDRGWKKLSELEGGTEFTRDGLRRAAALCRASAIINPLISRGLNLRIAYTWGQGVNIAARQEEGDEQDLNAVVQAFLDDPSNRASFTNSQAREELEKAFGTDGNIFLALFTDPLNGRVQVRSIPAAQIDDVICNPEDRDEPWFYKRTYQSTRVVGDYRGTRTEVATATVLYPAVGYWPRLRPKSIDDHEVMWNAPIVHGSVNRLDGWKFGIGDAYTAVSWARGYKEFLEDWAKLVKALSRFAWKTTAKGRNSTQVRARLAGASDEVGQAVQIGPEQSLEAIPKTGATIDSQSGRPLAAMVAAAIGIPVTMIMADPGVTGARAVAETLDQPMHLMIGLRQRLWASIIREIVDYVVDQAIKSPRGLLSGTRTVDQLTAREIVVLSGDQDRTIDITFASLSKTPIDVIIKAIVLADQTGKLPPLAVSRMLMEELGMDDVDELLAMLTDADGNFVDPVDALAAQSQQNAVARGDFVPPK